MMKRMKCTLCLILALLLTALPALTEGGERIGADLSYERIVSFCEYLRDMATGDYLDIKGIPQDQQAVAEKWAAGVSGNPRMIVQLDMDSLPQVSQVYALFRMEPDVVAMEAVSTVVIECWWNLAYLSAMESGVVESSYEEIMEVNSYINAGTMYAEAAPEGYGVFLVFYDGAAPIFLLSNAENDAVSIRGFFLPSQKLANCKNYGQVSLYLMMNGMTMTCKEVTP